MKLLLCLFGLVLIVEGLPYLAFPDKMKKWLQQIQQVPDNQLRMDNWFSGHVFRTSLDLYL
jgi:uncharacterized protein YjeT (DUF2065 family)